MSPIFSVPLRFEKERKNIYIYKSDAYSFREIVVYKRVSFRKENFINPVKVDPVPFLKILNMDLYSLRNFLLELEFSIQLSSIRFKQNIRSNPILEHEILKSYFSISLT